MEKAGYKHKSDQHDEAAHDLPPPYAATLLELSPRTGQAQRKSWIAALFGGHRRLPTKTASVPPTRSFGTQTEPLPKVDPIHARSSEAIEPRASTRKLRLFLGPIDPKQVKCCCGKYNDTTVRCSALPGGRVKCACGYVVTSSGYSSFHASSVLDLDGLLDQSKNKVLCACSRPIARSSKCPDCLIWHSNQGNVYVRTETGWERQSRRLRHV
jgi:hypothetical protein